MNEHPLGILVETDDGTFTMRHPDINEEYHSIGGALLEAEGLYRDASGLCYHLKRTKSKQSLAVLDVGLGLAYNALTTIQAWLNEIDPVDLTLISLEINETLVTELQSLKAPWIKGWPDSWSNLLKQLLKAENSEINHYICQSKHPHHNHASLTWKIIIGDASNAPVQLAKENQMKFDFIWQDPFSPQKNPDLWSAEWFEKIKSISDKNAILMTYSVAGTVRQALENASWHFKKIPAKGKKKQWLKACLNSEILGSKHK